MTKARPAQLMDDYLSLTFITAALASISCIIFLFLDLDISHAAPMPSNDDLSGSLLFSGSSDIPEPDDNIMSMA